MRGSLPLRRALLSLLACLPLLGFVPARAAEEMALDRWPQSRADDVASLQRGARLFVNYCLNCHSAVMMRWNRLRDIGIDEAKIKEELIFGDQRVGDTMTVAMNARDAKNWFGKAPPDLSVIIRARNTAEHLGTDYVYTLLRSFYRDRSTLTGWNNLVYPNIAMPHPLWQRQGPRAATIERVEREEGGEGKAQSHWMRVTSHFAPDGAFHVEKAPQDEGPESFSVRFEPADKAQAAAYDEDVADLVAYLNWMGEPGAATRYRVGVWVVGFLIIFSLVTRWLSRSYWKDVR